MLHCPSLLIYCLLQSLDFPFGSAGKEYACNVGDLALIPGLGRSPGEGKGYPLQYSGLESSMGCIVHGVIKSRTRLSDFHFTSITGALSTSIRVVLNSQSDNSNIPVMSSSDACSVSSDCALYLVICLIIFFFSISRPDVLCKMNWCTRTLVTWWWGMGGRKASYSCSFRSSVFQWAYTSWLWTSEVFLSFLLCP